MTTIRLFLMVALGFLALSQARAQVPQLINYQRCERTKTRRLRRLNLSRITALQAVFTVGLLLSIITMGHAQLSSFRRLHSFGILDETGGLSGLVADNALYGINGTAIFRMNWDGTGYRPVRRFDRSSDPISGVGQLKVANSRLYGTGGTPTLEQAIFRIAFDGSGLQVLHVFSPQTDPAGYQASISFITSGALYGTTSRGGTNNAGAIFKLGLTFQSYEVVLPFFTGHGGAVWPGENETTFYAFRGKPLGNEILKFTGSGSSYTVIASNIVALGTPNNEAFRGTRYYGSRQQGGTYGGGFLYRQDEDFSGYTVLYNFGGISDEPREPGNLLTQSDTWDVVGISGSGGVSNLGTIFGFNDSRLPPLQTLHSFTGADGDGSGPGALIHGRLSVVLDGNNVVRTFGPFYGTASGGRQDGRGKGIAFSLGTHGRFDVLRTFSRGGNDAIVPLCLVSSVDGRLYGTTEEGRTNNQGTLFRIDHDGTGYAVLDQFNAHDSDRVVGPIIEGNDGAFYGTLRGGGSDKQGAIYRLTKDGGNYSILHAFKTNQNGGFHPVAALVQGSNSTLYGTTYLGGNEGYGTVFSLNLDGTGFRTLHHFGSPLANGAGPFASLIEGNDGALYGTTSGGGTFEKGVVFKLSRDGTMYEVLHHFNDVLTVFMYPNLRSFAALIEGQDGYLYGTLQGGEGSFGAIFKLGKDGSGYRILKEFTEEGDTTDGEPWGPLLEGRDGALYGTTGGSVFKLQKDGNGFMVLRRFAQFSSDGAGPPPTGLVEGPDRALYGVNMSGGDANLGTLFRIGHILRLTWVSGRALLDFIGIPGYTYELQRSSDLQNWTPLTSGVMPVESSLHYEDTQAQSEAAFYRLHVP